MKVKGVIDDHIPNRMRHLSEVSVAGPQTSSHPHFKDETLGGLVMFDEFQAILDTKLL